MTLPPVSRRDFLGASAGSAALLASGPLFAQADALPSRKVTVGIMGLKRGMEVAAALEKQPGVVIKYVCDVDSKRADAGKAKLEKSGPQRPQAITDFRRILDDKDVDALFCEAPNHWHGPATILGVRRGQARLRREAVQPQSLGRRADDRGRPQAQPGGADGLAAAEHARRHRGDGQAARRGHRQRLLRADLVQQQPGLARDRQADRPAGEPRLRTLAGSGPAKPYVDNRIHYNWHWFWHWGNGELGNNGIHGLDLCRWGLGVEFPTTVVSSGGRYRFRDDQQTPDTHVANFEFPGGKQITWQGLSCNKHPGLLGVRHVLRRQGGARPGHVRRLQGLRRRRQAGRGSSGRREGREPLAGDRHVPRRRLRREDPQRRPLRR